MLTAGELDVGLTRPELAVFSCSGCPPLGTLPSGCQATLGQSHLQPKSQLPAPGGRADRSELTSCKSPALIVTDIHNSLSLMDRWTWPAEFTRCGPCCPPLESEEDVRSPLSNESGAGEQCVRLTYPSVVVCCHHEGRNLLSPHLLPCPSYL